MKRLIVNLTGEVTSFASRSFVLEVPDDANISTLDLQVLDALADDAKIAWEFEKTGVVLTNYHSVKELSESDESKLVVIPLEEKA